MDDPDFSDYIRSRIVDLSSSISCFQSILLWWDFFKESIKSDCISFARNKHSELSREMVVLTNRLINCKRSLVQGDLSVRSEIISLEAQLAALTRTEIEGVKLRSRTRWLEEGEKPTQFFVKLDKSALKSTVFLLHTILMVMRLLHVLTLKRYTWTSIISYLHVKRLNPCVNSTYFLS